VEDCLLAHPAVRACAVVGVADREGLTKPRAYVVLKEEAGAAPGDALGEELKAFVRERLAPYKHPREVVFLDELPRTHLGKVDRGKLRGM
jgi:acyl-coenzyme A synthetase/AMP-(fatty) acid ligase